MNRIQWIDVAKGIGILSVVVGHIWEPSVPYIYAFHMPFFFFISGYFYKPATDDGEYLKKKTLQLLVPYLSFLIVIGFLSCLPSINSFSEVDEAILQYLKTLIKGIYGGRILMGWLGVFWFITCLWITQQLYNFIYKKIGDQRFYFFVIILCFYGLANLNSIYFQDALFPWSVNVVAMSIVFYYVGHMYSFYIIRDSVKLSISVFIILISFGLFKNGFDVDVNMKYVEYGIPIINIVLPVSCILVIQKLAEIINSSKYTQPLKAIFLEFGQGSLVVMFVHAPLHLWMLYELNISNAFIRIMTCLLVSTLLYKVFDKYSFTAKMFLGKFSKQRSSHLENKKNLSSLEKQ